MQERIPVIFGSNRKPGSLAIRLFCWSRFSHCGIIDGDYVIEAVRGKGVIKTPLAEFKTRYRKIDIAQMPCDSAAKALHRARAQLGKPYDRLAIIGIVLRTGWQHPDKWFCSELLAYCSGGVFRTNRVSRVTPEHVWMVSY